MHKRVSTGTTGGPPGRGLGDIGGALLYIAGNAPFLKRGKKGIGLKGF